MTGFLKKAGLGAALAATALTAAAPADAQYYRGYRHHDRGGDAAAAAVIGGVLGLGIGAAIASNNNRNRYDDRAYNYDRRYNYNRDYYPQQNYYNNYSYREEYRPRCYVERRYDPYYGETTRVRICR